MRKLKSAGTEFKKVVLRAFRKAKVIIKMQIRKLMKKIIKNTARAYIVSHLVINALGMVASILICFSSVGEIITYLIDCLDGKRDYHLSFRKNWKFKWCRP